MKVFTTRETINVEGTTYSETFEIADIETVNAVQMTVNEIAIRAAGTLDITLQYSYDGVTWFDGTAFTQIAAVSSLSPSISPSSSPSISPSLSPSISPSPSA